MGNKEFELVSLLIKELPKYPESHSRGSDFYNMTFNILQEYVRNKFSDVTVDKISLGGFSEIVFPYHRMGNTTSLNLFELDELILFSYYYHSRNIYKNVLDLGANIGLHTYFLSKSGCSVKAYEPDPVHFELLKKTVDSNNLSNVETVNAAISDFSGVKKFIRVLGNTMSSHLSGSKENPYGELETFDVEVIDVNTIVGWADFIKMDIEGQEGKVVPAIDVKHWKNLDMVLEVGTEENASLIYSHLLENRVNMFSQKRGWNKVGCLEDMPTSYKEGSLFITCKDEMVWR